MRAYLGVLKRQGKLQSYAAFQFRHGASYSLGALGEDLPRLFRFLSSQPAEHFTGKLTEAMLESVLRSIRRYLDEQTK